MNKAVMPLAGFLLLVGLFWLTLSRMNEGEYNPRDIPTEFIGRPAPALALPDLNDPATIVRGADMQGRVWLLNVWGSWCAQCWTEHPYLMELAQRHNVPIIGLNWRDEAADSKAMLARLGNPYIHIPFDPVSSAAIDWGVYGAPETFLIDADGIVRVKHKGPLGPRIWKEKFAPYFDAQGRNS
jgi:cytochrome c biogenesis protein CcmG/thiol:disulfide interchange protein DsbE